MNAISETEPARLAQWFAREPLKRMGGLVSLPPANGLGLLVTLPLRERIADCAEPKLLHAAGNTRTTLQPSEFMFKGTLWSVTRRCRELNGSLSAAPALADAPRAGIVSQNNLTQI
jgi:hypothetical protein